MTGNLYDYYAHCGCVVGHAHGNGIAVVFEVLEGPLWFPNTPKFHYVEWCRVHGETPTFCDVTQIMGDSQVGIIDQLVDKNLAMPDLLRAWWFKENEL